MSGVRYRQPTESGRPWEWVLLRGGDSSGKFKQVELGPDGEPPDLIWLLPAVALWDGIIQSPVGTKIEISCARYLRSIKNEAGNGATSTMVSLLAISA